MTNVTREYISKNEKIGLAYNKNTSTENKIQNLCKVSQICQEKNSVPA